MEEEKKVEKEPRSYIYNIYIFEQPAFDGMKHIVIYNIYIYIYISGRAVLTARGTDLAGQVIRRLNASKTVHHSAESGAKIGHVVAPVTER